MPWRPRSAPSYQAFLSTLRAGTVLGLFLLAVCWLSGSSPRIIVEWPVPILWLVVALIWFVLQYGHAVNDAERRRRWAAHQRFARSVQREWGNMHPADRAIARGHLEQMGREGLGRREPPHTAGPPARGYPGYAWLNDQPPFGDGGDRGSGAA